VQNLSSASIALVVLDNFYKLNCFMLMGDWGLETPLELDILQKLCYLHKGD